MSSRRRRRPEAFRDAPAAGVYVLLFELAAPLRLTLPTRGDPVLAPGAYLYVGSAQRGLPFRLARHYRRTKRVHWHIDRVTTRVAPRLAAAWSAPREAECRLAGLFAEHWPGAVHHFGTGDCRCPTHLLGPVDISWLTVAESLLGPAWVTPPAGSAAARSPATKAES